MRKPLICLDFDGVLHSYTSGWQGARNIPDPPVPGAIDFLDAAAERFAVAIHSSRSRYWGGRRAMKRWLIEHLAEWRWERGCRIEAAAPQFTAAEMAEEYWRWATEFVEEIAFPLWKPAAHVTLDDRAITFTGTWPDLATLAEFKPWNRRAPAPPPGEGAPELAPCACGVRGLGMARDCHVAYYGSDPETISLSDGVAILECGCSCHAGAPT